MSDHDPAEETPATAEGHEPAAESAPAVPSPDRETVDEEGVESFPASDAPANSGTT